MDDDELHAFLTLLDDKAERLFRATGEHPLLAVIALTRTVVPILMKGECTEAAKAAIRHLFERAAADGARAVGFIQEAWAVTHEGEIGPDTPPPYEHPNRKEILMLTVASATATLAAYRPIVREGEAAGLGARVEVPPHEASYNRFLDRLPWSARWN